MEKFKENKMEINIAEIGDVNEILNLYPEADEQRLAKIRKDVIKDIQKSEKGERIIYGAGSDKSIVGTVQLVFKDDKEYYADGKTKAHLHHARVLEDLRGKGIGTTLMQAKNVVSIGISHVKSKT